MPQTDHTPDTDPSFVITRTFAASRERLWEAWTDPALMAQWLGPAGSTGISKTADIRPGGLLHWRMDSQGNPPSWGRAVYREVIPPSRLVYVQAFSDEQGGIVRAPFFDGKWPLELLTTVLFEADGPGTTVTLRWTPLDATETERAAFAANIPSMNGGWGGSFDRLAAHLGAG